MSYRQQGYRPQATTRQQQGGNRARTTTYAASSGRQTPPRSTKTNAGPQNTRPKNIRSPQKKRKRGHPFRNFLLLVMFALVATAGVMGYMVYEEIGNVERNNTFYPGVYINDVPLNGATSQEAYDYLMSTARTEMSTWSIVLRYGSEKQWTITTDTLGMSGALDTAVQQAVTEAYYLGRTGSIIDRYKTIIGLKTEPYKIYTADLEKNTSKIDGILSEIQDTVYKPAKDAFQQFNFNLNDPVVITAEEIGQELDVTALKTQLTQMVSRMEAGTLDVPTKQILPAKTAASLQGKVVRIANVYTQIASYSTDDRNKNVVRGVDAFHGMIVKPGETVSFNGRTGLRSLKNGFYEALEVAGGKYDWGVGGGICQVSSTLYNAVIQAGLEVVHRENHAIPVSYLPMGADATVADNRIDFKFRNNTEKEIYIIARYIDEGKKNRRCMFQIYGRPDPNGYSYALRHETIEELPIPSPTKTPDYKQEHVKYTDETYEASKGAVGYKVKTYLVVKDSHGVTIEDKYLYTDVYKPQAPVVLVGVERRN